jgi:hypothetical protein
MDTILNYASCWSLVVCALKKIYIIRIKKNNNNKLMNIRSWIKP